MTSYIIPKISNYRQNKSADQHQSLGYYLQSIARFAEHYSQPVLGLLATPDQTKPKRLSSYELKG